MNDPVPIRNLSPDDVAKTLKCSYDQARRLMRLGGANGGIECSDIGTTGKPEPGSRSNLILRTSLQDIQNFLRLREHNAAGSAAKPQTQKSVRAVTRDDDDYFPNIE